MPGSDHSQWGPNVVVADASNFEGALTWSSGTQASAIALSNGTTDPAMDGTHSLKITKGATNTGALAVNGSTDIPITASTAYVLTLGFYTVKASVTYNVNIDWYTSGQAFISSTLTGTATAIQGANTPPYDNTLWSPYPPQSVTSAATAAFARLNVQMVSGLTTGDLVWLDSVFLARPLVPTQRLIVSQAVNRSSVW